MVLDKNDIGYLLKIKPKTGFEIYPEIKGTGKTANKWFEATQNSSGTYELTAKGKLDMVAAESGGDGSSGGC